MSEEDAFLDGIAADRADRTRLLVFADWLADRGDPREEFVRLHARLLEMDGTEPEFADLEKQWTSWTASVVGPDCLPHAFGKLSERWLDAIYARPAVERAYAKAKEVNPNPGGIRTAEERAILFGQTAASVNAAVR